MTDIINKKKTIYYYLPRLISRAFSTTATNVCNTMIFVLIKFKLVTLSSNCLSLTSGYYDNLIPIKFSLILKYPVEYLSNDYSIDIKFSATNNRNMILNILIFLNILNHCYL